MAHATSRPALVTPVLVGGSLILLVGFAVRSSFGVFQIPIGEAFDWPRSAFSLAIAIQNLAWGFGQPFFSAIAERFGDRRAIVLGAALYALGLVLSAYSVTPMGHQVWNVLIGCGIAGTGFGVIIALVGRAAADEHRSMALGIATAAGSAGQIVGPPAAELLLGVMDWPGVFLVFAGVVLSCLLLLPMIEAPEQAGRAAPGSEEGMGAVVARALRDPSFALIFVGFFSCGYQLGFITAHFPALVTEMCGPVDSGGVLAGLGIDSTSALGAWALALIGLANIGGTLLAGRLGATYSKKYLLSGVYAGRTLLATWFILTPITPLTVVMFSVLMGTLWLATVPLTSGLVAQIYGLRYMGTLYGIVFMSHQVGSFLGVWMGGEFHDMFGSYVTVWWVGIGVGLLSALVHLPVRERPAPVAAA
jgi:MFS family permease